MKNHNAKALLMNKTEQNIKQSLIDDENFVTGKLTISVHLLNF